MSDKLTKELYGAFKDISKSFYYPTILMPDNLRTRIIVDYYMLRVADEIEDSLVEGRKKKELLNMHVDSLEKSAPSQRIRDFLNTNPSGSVQGTCVATNYDLFFEAYKKIPASSRAIISDSTAQMIPGMLNEEYREIKDFESLDEYCSFVAGKPGESITKLFGETGAVEQGTLNYLVKLSTNAGIGLQKVNILKDVDKDYFESRFYVPKDLLDKHGLSHENMLLTIANVKEAASRPLQERRLVVNELVLDAVKSLDYMKRYVLNIPVPNVYPAARNKSVHEKNVYDRNLSRGMRFFGGFALMHSLKTLRKMYDSPGPLIEGSDNTPGKRKILSTYIFMRKNWASHKAIQDKFDSLSRFE